MRLTETLVDDTIVVVMRERLAVQRGGHVPIAFDPVQGHAFDAGTGLRLN